MRLEDLPTALYRIYGRHDVLLYVGITYNPDVRFSQHAAGKPWWPLVVRTTVEWHDSRFQALAAEREAIQTEVPLFNIEHGDWKVQRAWTNLLYSMWEDPRWPVGVQRLPAVVRLTRIEPGFVGVFNQLWSLLQNADDFCGDCVWEGGGILSGPGIKSQVQALFGWCATNPLAQAEDTYNLAVAVAYECLPRGICTLHADCWPRDTWTMYRGEFSTYWDDLAEEVCD